MEYRIALAVLVVAGCTFAGKSVSGAAERRCRLVRQMIEGLRLLRVHVVNNLEPLENALIGTQLPLFVGTGEHLKDAGSVSEAWREVRIDAAKRGGEADCLRAREIDALDRLFERLGEGTQRAQEAAIEACAAALELAHDEAREQVRTSGRLYTTIGALTGLAIAVLLM